MKTYKSNISQFALKTIPSDFKRTKITRSNDAYDVIKQFYFDDIEIYESVFILLLNRASNTIGYAKISQGGVSGTVIDIKIIAKYAVDSLCSGVIMAHNHPSGNLKPSKSDIQITEKLKKALKLFDINLLDHIILTKDKYYSLADEGII